MTGVWATADVITAARMNEKTIFQGSGSSINGLTTYAGMLAFCTSSGSGFIADNLYQRDSTNASWSIVGTDKLPYLLLSTTIGDYTSPNAAVATSTASDNSANYLTQDGARIYVSAGKLNWDVQNTDQSNNAFSFDLGANLSDTAWVMRFKYVVNTITQTQAQHISSFFGMSSANSATDSETAQDSIGLKHTINNSVNALRLSDGDGTNLNGVEVSFTTTPSVTTYYVEIKRLTATTYSIELFSNSGYTTSIESQSGTCAATVTGLRYFKVANTDLTQAAGTNRLDGYIDDLQIDNGVTTFASADYSDTFTTYGVANAYNVDLTDHWKSNSEASPAIYFDLSGSAREIVGIALAINTTDTTVTAIKIRASTDTSFADAENIAYLNVSDFTDDTYRYIANNFLAANCRYVQVIGVGTGVLSVAEIKVRYGVSDLIKILTHKHRTRNVSAADSFTDSN